MNEMMYGCCFPPLESGQQDERYMHSFTFCDGISDLLFRPARIYRFYMFSPHFPKQEGLWGIGWLWGFEDLILWRFIGCQAYLFFEFMALEGM